MRKLYYANEWKNLIKKTWNGKIKISSEAKRRGRMIKRIIIEIKINVDEWGIKKIRDEKNKEKLRKRKIWGIRIISS